MEHSQIHENFIRFLEQERTLRGLTISQMAAALRIPYATYKNIIYQKSDCIDIVVACRLYELTGKMMWQMCGYDVPDSEFAANYTKLSDHDKKSIQLITAVLASPEL